LGLLVGGGGLGFAGWVGCCGGLCELCFFFVELGGGGGGGGGGVGVCKRRLGDGGGEVGGEGKHSTQKKTDNSEIIKRIEVIHTVLAVEGLVCFLRGPTEDLRLCEIRGKL